MSLEEFWFADPALCKFYRQAHKLKREQTNQELWLQGLYFYQALSSVLANAFSKHGRGNHKYLEEPIRIFPMTEEEKQEEERKQYEKINEQLHRMRDQQQMRKKQKG